MVSGQWSAVNGQRSMVSGQWSAVNGQRSMVSGQWSAVIGEEEEGKKRTLKGRGMLDFEF
jgi:hypothetical protein